MLSFKEYLLLEFDPNHGAYGRKEPKASSFADAKRQGLKGAKVNRDRHFNSLSLDGQTRLHAYSNGRAFQRGHGGGPEHDKDFETGSSAARSPEVIKDRNHRGDLIVRRRRNMRPR